MFSPVFLRFLLISQRLCYDFGLRFCCFTVRHLLAHWTLRLPLEDLITGTSSTCSLVIAMASPVPGPSSRADFVDDGPVSDRHLYTEEVVQMWSLPKVVRELGTIDQCLKFAEENNMVQRQKMCRTHRTPMRLSKTNKSFGAWVCTKGQCKQKGKICRNTGTFFENGKIDIRHVFYLIYAFAHKWTFDSARNEDPLKEEKQQCLSTSTLSDWYNYCRECVVIYQLERNEYVGKIGGPGRTVQIDESKFGKRKFNRGRHIEGHWVLGMIEDGSEDLRLEVCPDNVRSAEVLVPLIKKHVEEGTTIHTDCWRAYDCLAENGYIHKKVNHSDPDNPFVSSDGTHTQRIESQWRAVKRYFKKDNYNNTENFTNSIIEYLWRRNVTKNKKDPFIETINAINYVYKI